MISPAKAVAAGALIFALGGVLAIAQPFGQQSSLPGAVTEAIAPTWVTGSIRAAPSCSTPDYEVVDGIIRSRNGGCSPQTWTSSDPRLTGAVSRRWNDDTHSTDEGPLSVSTEAAYLRNDDGGWACSNRYLTRSYGMSQEPVIEADVTGTLTCVGSGGYEGLSAVLVTEPGEGFANEEFVGLVFSGDFPPMPEPPADE